MNSSALVLIALFTLQGFSAQAANPACPGLFKKGEIPELAKWREKVSYPNQSGEISDTNSRREKKFKAFAKMVETDIVENSSTNVMEFWPAEKSKVELLKDTEGYQSGIITRFRFSGLGPSGIAKGTLGTPVSGHDGVDKARLWSTTDTITILYEAPGSKRVPFNKIQSKDLVTFIELEIPLVKDQVVRILYRRDNPQTGHSADPSGFPEARIVEFEWNGT